jgi:dihydropteroate synthase
MALLRHASGVLDLAARPLVMGVLNVTPDSFSDGHATIDSALARAESLVEDGCDLLDIGGESTRPGARAITVEEECARVLPVIEALRRRFSLPLSLDTRNPGTAAAGLERGIDLLNQVNASLQPELFLPLLSRSSLGLIAMHAKAPPEHMQARATYGDVVEEVGSSLEAAGQILANGGIGPERVLYDPGIGFGKKLEHNLTLLRSSQSLAARLGRPLVIGLSRKSWLGDLLGIPVEERDPFTAIASLAMPFPAVAIHRVHQVRLWKQAFHLWRTLCS